MPLPFLHTLPPVGFACWFLLLGLTVASHYPEDRCSHQRLLITGLFPVRRRGLLEPRGGLTKG